MVFGIGFTGRLAGISDGRKDKMFNRTLIFKWVVSCGKSGARGLAFFALFDPSRTPLGCARVADRVQ
jgi:hypothetical protein